MTTPADGTEFDGGLTGPALDAEEVDELFDALADQERRSALRCLTVAGGSAPFDDLVDDVVRDTTVQPPDQERRQDVATAMYHVHLPKLEGAGLVEEYEPDGEVVLTDRLEDVSPTLFESS